VACSYSRRSSGWSSTGRGVASTQVGDGADVVEVRVREPDGARAGAFGVERFLDATGIGARVDDHRLVRGVRR
jgi:hypothetical protein